ncbi:YgjV family protein [Vibrio mediterranei]|uniref:YgjV family protein n=1 Tax=Vibrio mediterranei TaxID=689 RepID=UPI00148B9B70|nr:YgjV family protein [Vibrio mediterranei]
MDINFAQALGFVGYLIGITLSLQKDDAKLRFLLVCMCAVMMVHFALLGSFISAFMCILNGARTYFSGKTKSLKVMFGFITLMWILGLSQFTEYYQLITIFTSSLATYGLYRTSGIKMRLLFLTNNVGWTINNYIVGSIGGTLMESTFILMNLITIYRLSIDTKKTAMQDSKSC